MLHVYGRVANNCPELVLPSKLSVKQEAVSALTLRDKNPKARNKLTSIQAGNPVGHALP